MDPYLIIKDESEMLKTPNQLSLSSLQQPQYSKLVEKWCRFEYFYSGVDRWFFSHNQFKSILKEIGIGESPLLNKLEWGIVRSSIDNVLNVKTGK